ncbi:MAG: hypothetical protein K2W95_05730 [Candidatus Obscuribacterales bacterium]|nr:hypothetical protein [Candidatus Obscuribacterales bacterium]
MNTTNTPAAGTDKYRRRYQIAAVLLLIVGLAQMAGDLLGITALKALAAVTQISPMPKVFTAHKGLETYSTKFFIEYTDVNGVAQSIEITPELYGKVKGPYQRRNVYGAVLSYGPVLVSDPKTAPMFWQIANYALGGDAPLLRELGIDPATIKGNVRVRYEPFPGADYGDWPRVLEVKR